VLVSSRFNGVDHSKPQVVHILLLKLSQLKAHQFITMYLFKETLQRSIIETCSLLMVQRPREFRYSPTVSQTLNLSRELSRRFLLPLSKKEREKER